MIYAPLSRFNIDSSEALVAPGVVISAEGLALTRVAASPASGVGPSAGNSTEIFVGFSVAQTSAAAFYETFANKLETFVVPATGSVTLQFAPIAGQVSTFDSTTGTYNGAPTVVSQSVNGLTPGDVVSVTYKYTLSTTQAQALFGNVQPGGYVGAQLGQIGQVKRGLIYTSNFDASKNWAAATAIKLAPNGQLQDQTGTGQAINGYVVGLPSSDIPFLGIEFSAS